jgi:phosphate transport system permease protein
MIKNKDKVSECIFFIFALSSISALALITVFIFIQGAPIIANVGIFRFIFGMNWAPSQNEFGIFPMIVGSISVTTGAAFLGIPIGICCSIFLAACGYTFGGVRFLGVAVCRACNTELFGRTGA